MSFIINFSRPFCSNKVVPLASRESQENNQNDFDISHSLYKISNLVQLSSFTLCLVGGIIGRMENNGWKIVWKTVFFIVWEAKENREDGKSGRKFSSRTQQFFSSQIGRKTVERKLLLTWNYTNALFHLPSSQTQRLFWNQVKKEKKGEIKR